MKIVARLDPVALERELLQRIDAAHPRGEAGATLVLVPTARLAAHVQRRLGELRPAWLGLHVLDFNRLAQEILRRERTEALEAASDLMLAALLERLVAEHPDNAWAGFARRRPGTLRRLQETLNDLREAGVEPSTVASSCAHDDRGRALAELYEAYHQALEDAVAAGWTDRAGLVRAATPLASAFARGAHAVFVHGAYEWIGVNLDLLRAMDRATDVTVCFPAEFGRPVSRFAERFAGEFLLRDAAPENTGPIEGEQARFDFDADRGEDGASNIAGALCLDALYDEQSLPEPAEAGRLTFAHAQGAAAEVRFAVRQALSAIAAGCAPEEIAIVARSLAPYAAALEEIFEDEALPWTSSLGTPLRRRPLVRDFLLLLRVVEEEFPRRATAELLRSPRLDWRAVVPSGSPPPPADRVDAWTREAKLVGGLEDWTCELPRWAVESRTHPGRGEEPEREARRLADERKKGVDGVVACVEALSRAVDLEPRSWLGHATGLLELLLTFFRDSEPHDDARSVEELSRLLDEMGRFESLVGDESPIEFETMRQWLEQAVDATEPKLHPNDRGGIHVLDAMQLRGMTFRHVHLMGMNSGLFPRSPREDPILDDGARRRIAKESGLPLGRKLEAADEERLLLALLLGSARDAVHVSWQRADESGKAATPSLALREVARLRFGTPDLAALRREVRHLPSHPTHALEALLNEPGLLSPREAMLLEVLSRRGPEQAEELRQRYPSLSPGLTMLQATQAWVRGEAEFDARVGPLDSDPHLSVSALEKLGSCPLRFFFESVLGVREPGDEANPLEMSARDRGTGVHELLERVYRTLADEGLFEPERNGSLVERGLELLEENHELVLGDLGRRLSRRLPLLWRERARSWLAALRMTIRSDLTRIERNALRPLGFEETSRKRLDVGKNVTVRLSARFDRRLEGAEGVIVSDYKTSTGLERRVNVTAMLKGRALQVPLYQLLAGDGSSVELLGIHPELEEQDARVSFGGFEPGLQAESFRDTLRVLLDLRSGGSFPFNQDRHCEWCPFTSACRYQHPPSIEREQQSSDSARYRDLDRKSKTKPDG